MKRREFLWRSAQTLLLLLNPALVVPKVPEFITAKADSLRLFLCGDVMTGRGIDQVLAHPSEPRLYESCVRDARRYVDIAEEVNGPIPRPMAFPSI